MTDRLDVLMTREYQAGNETKTAFTKIGVAFPTKNGGYSVKLECIPAPKEGSYSFLMMPPRPDATAKRSGFASGQPVSDDVPW